MNTNALLDNTAARPEALPENLPGPDAAPQPGAALVVARWNSWVRLYFPEEGILEWVNLQDVPYTTASPPEAPEGGYP